jgi:hypothetical protein
MPTPQALLMLTLVAAAASIRTTVPVAVCLGVFAWLFLTGFVVNDLGELRVHRGVDWLRLAVLLGSTWLVAHATGPVRGAARASSPDPVVTQETADGWKSYCDPKKRTTRSSWSMSAFESGRTRPHRAASASLGGADEADGIPPCDRAVPGVRRRRLPFRHL